MIYLNVHLNILHKLLHIIFLEQASSNAPTENTIQNPPESQFQTTPTRKPIFQTLSFTPAQTSLSHNTQHVLAIITLRRNPTSNYTTSRNLSRVSLPTMPNNQLWYSLTST